MLSQGGIFMSGLNNPCNDRNSRSDLLTRIIFAIGTFDGSERNLLHSGAGFGLLFPLDQGGFFLN
jgi:hypothetical protein